MTDALLAELFSRIDDYAALKKRYAAESKKREELGLALARFETYVDEDDGDVASAVRAEGSGDTIAPLLLAYCLAEEDPRAVSWAAGRFRMTLPAQALPGLRVVAKRIDDKVQTLRAKKKTQDEAAAWAVAHGQVAGCLATLGDTKLAETLVAAHPELVTTLLERGIGVDDAIARLEKLEDDEDALREAAALMTLLAEGQVERAVPAILPYVRSGIFIHALAALATLKDPRGIEPARAILRETCGDSWSVNILRLAAEHVLRAHGEVLPLDLARAAVYWPIVDYRTNEPEALALRVMAVSALASHGDAKDKKLAKKQITSPYRAVREAAKKAFDKPPSLVAWDRGRIAWTKKNGGAKALTAALEEPRAIFRDVLVKVLAEDAKAKADVARFILSTIEDRMTMPYDDDIELDVDVAVYLEVGEELASGAGKKIFAASKNPWVKVKILGADEDEIAAAAKKEKEREKQKERSDGNKAPIKEARVTRFDAPPHAFPRGVTALVLAEDAERLLVLGPESFLFDPQSAERLLSIGDAREVTASALAADGSRFALARGSKIGVYDGTTGEIVGRLEAPGNVTALAFSPDGAQLACGTSADLLRVLDATSASEVFAAKSPGAVRGVGWLGSKRAVFLADKGKKSVLVDVDVVKKKSADVSVPLATKLVTRGKWLATAGGKRAALHDAKLAVKHEVETEEPIVDLAIEDEKTLVVRYPESLTRAKLGGKTPKFDGLHSELPVRALAASGKRLYALCGDTLTRFHEDSKAKRFSGAHDDHVCGIAVLPSGEIVTNSWDGSILLFEPEGGTAEVLFARKERIDDVALSPQKDRLYFGDGHTLRCIDLSSREGTVLVGGDEVEADIAEHMPQVSELAASRTVVAWADGHTIHFVGRQDGTEIATAPLEEVESLAVDEGGRFYAGTEGGTLACFDAEGALLWSRVEHGRDMLKGMLYGDPHRSVAYLATHGSLLASLGSDDSVRVFDGPSGARKLRCFCGVGIFNAVAFSPSGKRIAFTYGGALEVRDIETGALECIVDDWAGPAETMGVAFTDERTLLVGTGMGAIHRVVIE